jgi:phage portal protein BeeE
MNASMKFLNLWTIFVSCCFTLPLSLLVGCGNPGEKIYTEQVQAMTDFVALTGQIQNDESAKQTIPKLKVLTGRMQELQKQLNSAELSTEQQLEFTKRFQENNKDLESKLNSEHSRLGTLKLKEDVFTELQAALLPPAK